jgi:hypothetical protein
MFDEAIFLTSAVGEHTAYCLWKDRVYLGVNERFVYWSCQCMTLSPCEDSPSFVPARHGRILGDHPLELLLSLTESIIFSEASCNT